jgi:hypothetical protein
MWRRGIEFRGGALVQRLRKDAPPAQRHRPATCVTGGRRRQWRRVEPSASSRRAGIDGLLGVSQFGTI